MRSFSRIGLLLVSVCLAGRFAPAAAQTNPASSGVWMKLFDAKTLNGWQCRAANWKVNDADTSVTGTGPVTFNTFFITDSSYDDFRFKTTARLPGTGGYRNSGIVYRGNITDKNNSIVAGYQEDISDNQWGSFYHEQGNELPWTPVTNCSPKNLTDWVTMEVYAHKDTAIHIVNGKNCWEHTGFKVTGKGIIALQLHNPGDFAVEFKDIYIQPVGNSFKIPADNAWDDNGKQVQVTGINIVPNTARAPMQSRSGVVIVDANGRAVPVFTALELPQAKRLGPAMLFQAPR